MLTIWHKDTFWIVMLSYGLLIRFILNKSFAPKVLLSLKYTVWGAVVLVFGLIFYVNHYLPHGPSYPTGDVVCQNDDRGPCREEYKEDMRRLNIPNWAKFLRGSSGGLLLMGLIFAGIALNKDEKQEL